MIRLLGMFLSTKGIWHYELERDGKHFWASLNTRSEQAALTKYKRMERAMEKAKEP